MEVWISEGCSTFWHGPNASIYLPSLVPSLPAGWMARRCPVAQAARQAARQARGWPAVHSELPLVADSHVSTLGEGCAGPFWTEHLSQHMTNMALPLILPCGHSLASHPTYCHKTSPISMPTRSSATKDGADAGPITCSQRSQDSCQGYCAHRRASENQAEGQLLAKEAGVQGKL